MNRGIIYGLAATALIVMPARAMSTQPVDATGEAAAIAILSDYVARYQSAPNDMAKGALRPQRGKELCTRVPFRDAQGAIRDWTGTVEKLSSTTEGQGVLVIRIAPHITVGTTNNSFSDRYGEFKTLIEPGTPVYRQAVALSEGQQVRFSGLLFPSKTDCMSEKSLTQAGSMTEPEFLFRFSRVEPVE